MLYWRYEKYIKSLCSFGEPLPPQAAKLPGAKMEAGENPARSRHCKCEFFQMMPLNISGRLEKSQAALARRPAFI